MFDHGIDEQRLELCGAFRVFDTPADTATAEDVEDDIEIKAGPFHRPHQFGDVPGPDLVGAFGRQLWFLTDRVAALAASFRDLTMLGQDPIHRAD